MDTADINRLQCALILHLYVIFSPSVSNTCCFTGCNGLIQYTSSATVNGCNLTVLLPVYQNNSAFFTGFM